MKGKVFILTFQIILILLILNTCYSTSHKNKKKHKNNKHHKSIKKHAKKKHSKISKRDDIEKELYMALLKRSDVAEDLYKNVLPYIKEVAKDAAKTKQEIRIHKPNSSKIKHMIKHDKTKILKELDKKVLPWLNDITKKVNSISDHSADKLRDDLRKAVNSFNKVNHDVEKTKEEVRKTNHQNEDDEDNNGQPNLLEYDEHNQPIVERKEEDFKKKFEAFIKSKEKQFEKNELKLAKHKKPPKRRPHDPMSQSQTSNQQTIKPTYAMLLSSTQLPSPVISLQQQSTNFQQGTPQLLQYQQATDFGPMEVLQQPTIQALNQLPTVNTVVQQPIPQHIQSEENKNIESEVAELTNQIAEFQQEMDNMAEIMPEELIGVKEDSIEHSPDRRNLHDKSSKKSSKTGKKTKPKKMSKPKKEKNQSVTMIFAGNLGLDGIVRYKVEENLCTYNESFDKVKEFLKKADHVVVNLDTVFVESNEHELAEDKAAEVFSYAGIDTVVVANDHLLDFGPDTAMHTLDVLRDSSTYYSGFTTGKKTYNKQEPVVYATNGVAIALLSYCMNGEGCRSLRSKSKIGPAVYHEDVAIEEVSALRESGIDIVIVYLHWGNEENLTPTYQIKNIVMKLTKVKIDLLVGCHPYVESHYFYRNTLVVFSLGNFLTPMHVQIHKTIKGGSKSANLISKLWNKQSERWELPSMNSKLLQVQVNRDGLIQFKTKYLPIHIGLNKNHCPQPQPSGDEGWIKLCSQKDRHCEGTNKCNELECNISLA